MARPQNGSREAPPGLRQEIAGILLIAVAAYIAVCLFSGPGLANWGGVVGENLSAVLFTAIGYTSYVFPLLISVIALKLVLRRVVSISLAVPISFVFFIPSLSALLYAVFGTKAAGDIIGLELFGLIAGYLGVTGAIIILAAVALASVVMATGTSVVHGSIALAPWAAAAFGKAVSLCRLFRENPEAKEEKSLRARRGKD